MIHSLYRQEKPVKLANLIEELNHELAYDDIPFSPSLSQMRLILKGLGFRYEVVKGNPQIYEREDLKKLRHEYLRLEICLRY
jgi:hypothetical protein